MASVVLLITNDDGDLAFDFVWHYYQKFGDSDRTLCSGEVFGSGESKLEYKTRDGLITCKKCIEKIKTIKRIKNRDLLK